MFGLLITLALPTICYLATLYPGVGGRVNPGDSIKFQYVGSILGVPHEPGYPQYVVLSYLWTALPWPFETALQVNLLSAICTLVAGGFLWRGLDRLTERPFVAVLGTWTLLLSRPVWVFSTEAEVHALQLLWACVCFWLVVRWTEDHDRRWLVASLAAVALSFGNHPLAVTLLLGAGALILVAEPGAMRTPRIVVAGLALGLLGLSQYGFLLLRSWQGAPYLEAVPPRAGLHELWQGMTGPRFVQGHWLADGLVGFQESWSSLVEATALELSFPLLVLAMIGMAMALRRRSQPVVFLLAMLAGSVVVLLCYQIPDPQPYRAHLWMPLAALATLGTAALPRAWRLAVCLVWAALLGGHLWRDALEIDVPRSAFDRTALVTQAPPHTKVLLEDVGRSAYPAVQLANYYTHAFSDKQPGVSVEAARTGLQTDALVGSPPLVFSAPEIGQRLDDLQMGYRSLGARDGRGRRIYLGRVNLSSHLELVRSAEGLEVRSEAHTLVTASPGIHAVIVDPRAPGIRAVVLVPWGTTPSTERRIWEILHAVRRGDTLCLVIQGNVARVERLVMRLAPRATVTDRDVHTAVLIANLHLSPHWLTVLTNPDSSVLPVDRWTENERNSTR